MPQGCYERKVQTTITKNGEFSFRATLRSEGAKTKGNLRIVIPQRIVRGLQHLGWNTSWLAVQLPAATFKRCARSTNSGSVVVSIPKAFQGTLKAGDVIDVVICNPLSVNREYLL